MLDGESIEYRNRSSPRETKSCGQFHGGHGSSRASKKFENLPIRLPSHGGQVKHGLITESTNRMMNADRATSRNGALGPCSRAITSS